LAASETVTVTASTAPAAGASSGGDRVRLDGHDRGALGDGGLDGEVAGEDRLGRLDTVTARADVDDVGEQTGAGLDRQTAGDLLALRRAADQHGGRLLVAHELGQRLGLGGHEVLGQLGGVEDVDLLSAVLRQVGLRRVGTGTDEDGRRRAEAARERQELTGGLAYCTVEVIDENENLTHLWLLLTRTSSRRGTRPA
jgi:hypothetical protein